MTYQTILYAVDGRVARITLNRPARMNAINLAMPGEIAAAVEQANSDDAVHVIVLTGASSSSPRRAGSSLVHSLAGTPMAGPGTR